MSSEFTTHSPCRSDEFRNDVVKLMSRPTQTCEFHSDAMNAVAEYAAAHSEVVVLGKIIVHSVLRAMLDASRICNGIRYTSCAILACSTKRKDAGIASNVNLKDLVHYWVDFLLWPVRSTYKIKVHDYYDSDNEDTIKSEKYNDSTHKKIIARDNARCVVSGFRNQRRKHDPPETPLTTLEATHILRRSIIGQPDQPLSPTSDILRSYADLSTDFVEGLPKLLDEPQNGFLVSLSLRLKFDRFRWCLLTMNTEHTYQVKWFCEPPEIAQGHDVVRFVDHGTGLSLPSPKLFAVHAALTHVLHESGVGKFFEDLVEDYFDEEMDRFFDEPLESYEAGYDPESDTGISAFGGSELRGSLVLFYAALQQKRRSSYEG